MPLSARVSVVRASASARTASGASLRAIDDSRRGSVNVATAATALASSAPVVAMATSRSAARSRVSGSASPEAIRPSTAVSDVRGIAARRTRASGSVSARIASSAASSSSRTASSRTAGSACFQRGVGFSLSRNPIASDDFVRKIRAGSSERRAAADGRGPSVTGQVTYEARTARDGGLVTAPRPVP